MHHKFLFVTLFISTPLFGMEGKPPKQQEMFYGTQKEELLKKVPSILKMDEYAALPGTQWVVDSSKLQEFKSEIENDPYFKFLCANTQDNAEAIEELISITNERTCGHACKSMIVCLHPCALGSIGGIFAYRTVQSVQEDKNCWTNCTLAFWTLKLAGYSLLKRYDSLRGISDSTQKTLAARSQFVGLRTSEEARDTESKKNK